MEKFKFSKHTADAKFKAYGKNLEQAFKNAALAMFSLMINEKEINAEIKKDIRISAVDKKNLLYKWLEELLFLLDTEGFLLKEVNLLNIKGKDKFELTARVTGDKVKEKYKIKGEVKAVTYHEMEVKEEKNKTVVQVVVDL
jgi:SHS2 domain-containing protein